MESQIESVNNSSTKVSTKIPSKEPSLKFNMAEFLEMRRLKTAGDLIGIQDLEKKVRQRMESEASETVTTSIDCKKDAILKQVKSKASSTTGGNLPIKNLKNAAINQKRPETTASTCKNVNLVRNDKKAVVKKERTTTATTSKSTSTGGNLSVNNEKHDTNKEKLKSVSKDKSIRGNFPINKSKQTIYQGKSTSLKSVSKVVSNNSNNLSINNGKRSTVNKEKSKTMVSSSITTKSIPKLEKYVERWKLSREIDGKYKPLERFLPSEILNNKNWMETVKKIAKGFELERLRRLLEQDKEKLNGRRTAQERIEHFNHYGKDYTRLEIAAVRNEIGPKRDQQIRSHIAFLNEKNIVKNKVITQLDVIENPVYLKKAFEERSKQNKGKILQEDLERKRKFERSLNEETKRKEKLAEEMKRKSHQGKKRGELESRLSERRYRQERVAETKRHQAHRLEKPIEADRRNRVIDPRCIDFPKKIMTNKNGASTSTSLKKRTFDERSEVASSSRERKRRNIEDDELDICGLDEETLNRNISTIIHSIVRPGRRPIYGMDDNDDDVMEVSGYEVFREEARSSRLARKEDEEEERAEQKRQQQRRIKKLKSKKGQR